MMSARLIRISRLPFYGCRRAGLISNSHVQLSSDLAPVGQRTPITVTHTAQIQPASFCSDLASRKYSLIYTFPAIRGLRALSRLKLMQTGITVILLPTVYVLYLQGQASVMLLSYSTGITVFAGLMLYSISHYVRRVVGMMHLDSTQTILKVSHLNFWGHRRDMYVPVSDVMTLGDSGDTKGEPILRLKRYSCSDTMYFSTRLGRVVDRNAFEKIANNVTQHNTTQSGGGIQNAVLSAGALILKEVMYFIVSFVDTEEVEIVPAIWVMDGMCLWPPYKGERVQRAAKRLEQPQESWSAYKVKIMYTANSYSEGCRKLTLAQQIDLQTEAVPDSLMPPKHQIKRDRCLLDDYDPDEETKTPLKDSLPQAPQIQPLPNRICSASDELQASPLGQSQNQSPGLTQSAKTSKPSLLETSPASKWDGNTHQISQQLRSSCDPFIASLLHDILTKQEILMEQQRKIMRMVQDLKGNNVSETTEASHSSPERSPVEDISSLTSQESDPETTVEVETYSGSEEDEESCPVQIRKKRVLKIGKPCGPTCGKKCTEKILHAQRKEIFNAYLGMSRSDKWAFVFHSVTQSLKTHATRGRPSRRNKTYQYHLNNSLGQPQEVCKTFYLTTLGYHPKNDSVIFKVTGSASGAVPPPDRRGRHPPPNKIDVSPIYEHIESFNPSVGDYKCEHVKGRRYLPSSVTITMMYKDYKGKSSTPCSYETYRKAIKDMNIVFRKLNAKRCKECLERKFLVKTEHL